MPPYERLELSSAVKVRTHQFSPLNSTVSLTLLCVCFDFYLFIFLREKGESGADRIRPLGVTVLSGIRPATPSPPVPPPPHPTPPPSTHTHSVAL